MFFTSKKNLTIRDQCVHLFADEIAGYSDWYEEKGLKLPPDFAQNPSEWTEVLHKMKRAFQLLKEEKDGEGAYWLAKNKWKEFGIIEQDTEEIEEYEEEIQEGLMLFGKYLFWLTDDKTR